MAAIAQPPTYASCDYQRIATGRTGMPLVLRRKLQVLLWLIRDIDSLAKPSARSQGRISHWASVRFCNRRPRKGARNMSQGLRALVLLVPQATNRHVYN